MTIIIANTMMIVIVKENLCVTGQPKPNVKTKMIERTALLLATKGLQGTSFTEILEQSGAPRGSLYHHFPGGKDELVLAALKLAGNHALARMEALRGRPAPEIAKGFIGLWRELLIKSNFSAGCAVVAVTVAADSREFLEATGSTFEAWQTLLADLLATGGVHKARSPALAASLIAACEGAVVMARAMRSPVPFDLVAAEQLATITAAAGP
jgi:TetR/AcrR family transcriptional regulator, lmrAB and yxaGH operons repressor